MAPPDPHREVGRVDQVRYVGGAPREWGAWLRPDDTISLVSLGGGIAVENSSGRGFLPMSSIQRIDLEDPVASVQGRDNSVDWGKMTLGLMNMGALQALPRRPLGILTITAVDQAIAFDVSERTWSDEALVKPEVESSLIRAGESMVHIRDGSYRWISVKRFSLPAGTAPQPSSALGLLLGHPAYWDNYLGGDGIDPHRHGPYRLEAISPEVFVQCDAGTATRTLDEWLHRHARVPEDQIEGSLPDVYRLIDQSETCFRLPDLGESAQNDVWFILDKPFLEIVLAGPANQLTLIVASGN